MRPTRRLATTGAIVATLSLLPLTAFATPGSTGVPNGGFEDGQVTVDEYDDHVDGSTIPGWTVMNQVIDLGVTPIAGCTTVDTSDYTQLRGWDDNVDVDLNIDWDDETTYPWAVDEDSEEYLFYPVLDDQDVPVTIGGLALFYEEDWYYGLVLVDSVNETLVWQEDFTDDQLAAIEAISPTPDPVQRADDLVSLEGFFDDEEGEPEFAADVVDATDLDSYETYDENDNEIEIPFARESQVLRLSSDMDADGEGYVAHGPAVYSDAFTVPAGRQINLRWAASGASDDFHVFGYLLNVDTCAQTEVIDATGEYLQWTTASTAIPAAGTYRFVFVGGTYDQSWGGAAGALLYIDDIVQTPVVSGTGLALDMQVAVGASVQGGPVQLIGGGLLPGSEYQVVLQSTPRTIYTGTADLDGNFLQTIMLPEDIEPGSHTLTLHGTGPNGEALTSVAYFTVGTNGELLYLSYDAPQGAGSAGATGPKSAALAVTGSDGAALAVAAGLLVLTGTAGLLAAHRRRTA